MAINKVPNTTRGNVGETEVLFEGRVIEVTTRNEYRNMSDTLDYSDYRHVSSTYALVWLGTHGIPPHVRDGVAYISHFGEARDLEFFEQFALIDVSNHFADRYPYYYADVVADVTQADGKQPLLWANYFAWQAYLKAQAEAARQEFERLKAEREVAEAAASAKAAAKAAKRAAADAAGEAAAKQLLASVPPKGTTVTVDGFTGRITWTGVKKFRNKWQARVGIRNSRGEMAWVDAARVTV